MPDFISRYGSRSNIGKEQTAVVRLLDDDSATVRIDFKKIAMGQYVVDYCCDYLNLMENDYFGIRYMDTFKHRYWLDAAKLIVRQVKGTGSVSSPLSFSFRVKFYPADPGVLKEDITRYHLYLQVKRDLSHGRLYCPPNEAAQLAAYVLQAEVGDYNPEVHEQNYVSMYPKVLLRQSTKQEEKIAEYHKEFSGLSPVEAHSKFLQLAATFDTYGFDPYTVKDPKQPQNQAQVYLGATHRGVLVYSGNRKLYHLEWKNISLITCGGKDLIIAQNPSAVEKKYQKLIFHCSSATFSKHLMKYINEQRVFFTFPPPRPHGTSISGKSGSSWQNSNFNKNLTLPKNFRPNKQGLDAGPISNGPPNRTRPQILETSFDTVTEPITLSSRMNSPRGPFDTSQLMDTTITTMSRDESRVMPSTSYFMDNSIIEVDEPGWSPDVSGGDNNSGVAEAIAAANKKAQLRIETILQEAKDQELYDEKMKEADDEDKKRSHMSLPVRLADKPLTVITRQPQSNGRVHVEPEPAVVLPATDQSLVGRIANAVFAAFLVSFIVISLVVLVMEVKDPSFRTMLDSVPQTYVFRSTVYEPVKSAVTSTYSRMLGRR